MSSKYDAFWQARLDQIDRLIDGAVVGYSPPLDVSPIRQFGVRESWYGKATVKGTRVSDARMAHLMSLARQVAAAGLCARFPNTTFVFIVDRDGRQLTASLEGADQVLDGPADNRAEPPNDSPSFPASLASEAVLASSTCESGEAAEACGEVHRLLERLPTFKTPDEVPFGDGLYFFYEHGETSTAHAASGRIVRVGNHPRSTGRLVQRLREHYAGEKNSSVFRLLLGGALIRRDDPGSPCLAPGPGQGHWERHMAATCPRCEPYEQRVSTLLLERFLTRYVRIEDRAERNHFEARLIATIAACPVCSPSPTWLGRYSCRKGIQTAGVWNSEFVGGETLSKGDLERLRVLVSETPASRTEPSFATPQASDDLSSLLLLIPCSGGKRGHPMPKLPPRTVVDALGTVAATELEQGRSLASFCLDKNSEVRPALGYYTGMPYAASGFRELLVTALRQGLHCLIVSAGYGLLRPEEPIHCYEAQMPQMRFVWKRRIPEALRDYVQRNGIRKSFGAFSSGYASVVPPNLTVEDWRAVPKMDPNTDSGAALRVVPRKVGEALVGLLRSGFRPSAPWKRS